MDNKLFKIRKNNKGKLNTVNEENVKSNCDCLSSLFCIENFSITNTKSHNT